MKILKIFGIVVGIHIFALILIFANPGCSSTTKPPPSTADTAVSEPPPSITVPNPTPASDTITPGSVPPSFNPDAPATYGGSSSGGVRFPPIRPNTPAASAVTVAPVENVTPATTYTVKAGDSFWSLQKKFHVSYKEIAAANNLRVSTPLHEGQKIIIPSKAETSSAATTTSGRSSTSSSKSTASPAAATTAKSDVSTAKGGNGEEVTYTVKPGETLGQIAKMFDMKAKDLGAANNISDPRNLRAGTVLKIPGGSWKAPGGKASKSSGSTAGAKSTPAPSTEAPPPVIGEPDQTPPASSSVPVIKIDEGAPSTPAPKS